MVHGKQPEDKQPGGRDNTIRCLPRLPVCIITGYAGAEVAGVDADEYLGWMQRFAAARSDRSVFSRRSCRYPSPAGT